MKTARDIALIGVYTALLLGGQFVLSGISGVEIVTALFLGFCYSFGIIRGVAVANAFSLLRCFIFGFFPTVIILYLVYYNIFAVICGLLGRVLKRGAGVKEEVIMLFTAIVLTVFFTCLDNVITPLYYGFSSGAAKAYALSSLAALVPQVVCVTVTVALLFPVLCKVFAGISRDKKPLG